MATPVFYQTLNNMGVDPTVYYTNTASVTPEYPAPPFLPGTRAFGSDGSEFVFVQASTSISLTDFVAINAGATQSGYQANSLTATNIQSSLLVGIASTGLILKQSVSFIPAAAFFWALTRGQFVPATTSGASLATNTPSVLLFTSATAGVVTSVTTANIALQGIVCINSLTTGIAASVVPPAGIGTQLTALSTSGLTLGPVVNINLPRTVSVVSSVVGTLSTGVGAL